MDTALCQRIVETFRYGSKVLADHDDVVAHQFQRQKP